MAIGDLDGDGCLDLAVSNFGSDNVSVLINRGNTISAELTCVPSSGTLPFDTTITATLVNEDLDFSRRIAGHIDVDLAGGQHYSNYRRGYTNVHPGDSKVFSWLETFSNGDLIGTNIFTLVAEDVTPSPYNQPPYPSSGSTDTDTCTVVGSAP